MQEITVYDINGDVLRNLVQWDINIKICIKEPAIDKAYKVHFFNLKSSEALVVESEFSNGVLSAIIPTILLMEPYPITGYIYFEKNNEHKSVYCFTFSMRKRPKPANYVYNNEKNYFTFEEVLAEAKEYALNALNYATESRSYARGDTGTRPGETTDSALYYYNQSKASAEASKVSETNSAKYAENAKNSADAASASASTAQRLANEAEISANNSAESASVAIQKASEASDSASRAKQSETNSKASETAAGVSEANAAESEANALTYKNEAKTSETNAKASEIAAALSQKNALASENAAKVSEDNSKTSEENSKISETNASVSETNAKISETNSKKSEENAKNSELKALVSQDAAKKSEDNAQISESNALTSAQTATDLANIASTKAEIATAAASSAKIYESNATDSALAAEVSATEAANSANEANTSKASAANSALEASDNATLSAQKAIEAKDSAENAAASEANAQIIKETVETYVEEAVENATIATEKAQEAIDAVDSIGDSVDVASQKAKEALDSANLAKSYSTGTDGQIREDDNVDCAKYYYEQSKKISQGFNGVIPMGTITFDGLDDESNQQPGYMFNISDSFISDERFNDGGGIFYGAGNNLMFTADGKWDVFASSMVSGVKGEAESEYRQGFVNITPANIGLEKVPNVSTNDQTPTFTQATTRANIASGEKLSVIFGKIMKWFVDIKSVAFSGSYNDLLDKPTSLPANGGTAETISEILSIEKGGTGGNTKKAVNDIVATGSDISDPATFSENDRFLWVFNGSNVIKSKFVTLIKYIESKLASVASSGSYNDLTDKPTTMKNPKALNFEGGSFLLSYDGSVEKTINLPSTLPANGGTAQTISDTLPIEKGGTGQTTAKDALRALVEGTEDGTSTPTDNDWYLCQTYNGGANDQSVVRRKTISLWSYIKSKCDALFLKLSGGTMSGTINSSKTTGTYLAGNQGQAIINSTAAANTYTMLDKLNSTNGVFTDGVYQNKRLFQYTAKSTVDAGTNAVTKSVTLLDEDGNTKFPGTVTAPRFAGTADVANKLGTATVGAASRPIYLNGGTPTPIGNKFSLADGITSQEVIQLFDDGDTANNGGILLIRGGGNLFIGSGESPENLYNTFKINGAGSGEDYSGTAERLYITSDGETYLITNCQNINSRKGLKFFSDNNYMYIKPFKNSEVIIGEDHFKLRGVYADTFYGNLIGTAKHATALEDMYGTLIAEVSNINNYKCIKIGDNTNNLSLGLTKTTIAGEDSTMVRLKANDTDFFTYGPLNASKEIRMFADNATFETELFYLYANKISFSGGIPSGNGSFSQGYSSQSLKEYSNSMGYSVTAGNFASSVRGKYNTVQSQAGSASNTTGLAFVIGNGTSSSARSNAFSVQYTGVVKAKSTITGSTTADYAEYFEWEDENFQNEDRVGLFVTINEEKISIANPEDDYILGIVSGEPFVLGNGDCDTWNGMFLRDDFGRTIYERAPMVKYNEETKEEELQFDEDGNLLYYGTRPVLNPKYNPDEPYISRQDRPEWAPIGMLGVLSVRQDGTITHPNTYATVGENGFATLGTKYNENHYRVIKVISPEIVKVIFK